MYPDTTCVAEFVAWMHDDLVAFTQSIQDLGLQITSVPDLYSAPTGAIFSNDEDIPIIATAKQGAERYFEDARALPCDDSDFDAIGIAQLLRSGKEVQHHINSLLFNSESGDLGKRRGLHQTYPSRNRIAAAPLFNHGRHSSADLHGVGGQEISNDFEAGRVSNGDNWRAGHNDAFALFNQAEHASRDWRTKIDRRDSSRALCDGYQGCPGFFHLKSRCLRLVERGIQFFGGCFCGGLGFLQSIPCNYALRREFGGSLQISVSLRVVGFSALQSGRGFALQFLRCAQASLQRRALLRF